MDSAEISQRKRENLDKERIWAGSPFEWIQQKSPSAKGKIRRRLITKYLTLKGFDVTRSSNRGANMIIAGKLVETKTSSLWKGGIYKFQQLRDQDYDFVLCLGISPLDVHCWAIPKRVIMDKWYSGEIPSQHLGQEGIDTAWLSINPHTPPEWIKEWGGSLAKAVTKIIEITGHKPLF